MKTFEFTEQEIQDLRKAINFYADYVYLEDGPYYRVKMIANKITPKKVTKEGWMVVHPNGHKSYVLDSEFQARQDALRGEGSQVVKITWEQEE